MNSSTSKNSISGMTCRSADGVHWVVERTGLILLPGGLALLERALAEAGRKGGWGYGARGSGPFGGRRTVLASHYSHRPQPLDGLSPPPQAPAAGLTRMATRVMSSTRSLRPTNRRTSQRMWFTTPVAG